MLLSRVQDASHITQLFLYLRYVKFLTREIEAQRIGAAYWGKTHCFESAFGIIYFAVTEDEEVLKLERCNNWHIDIWKYNFVSKVINNL